MSYPKWVSRGYGMGDILCTNEDDEKAVLKDAEDRKAEAAAAAKKDAEEAEARTVEAIRARLDELGIKYDKRLGLEKLKELLPKE